MTTIDVESQLTFLYDALIDLATNADRQAARAAEFDDTMASSALFTLADQLRTMAHTVRDTPSSSSASALLDSGRQRVALARLRFDDEARKASDAQSNETPEAQTRPAAGAQRPPRDRSSGSVSLHLAGAAGSTRCGQRNPTHVTDGIRYVDCVACIAAARADEVPEARP